MRPEEIFQTYADRQYRQRVARVGLITIAILGSLMGSYFELPRLGTAAIFFGSIALLGLFTWWNWRCPACARVLGSNGSHKHCPACGSRLVP